MAQAGVSKYQKFPAAVTGYGTGASDGWQAVFTLPGDEMPGGTGPKAFFTTCNIGAAMTNSNSTAAMMEVCVGSSLGPDLSTVQRMLFSDAWIGRLSMPYTVTQVFDTGSIWGTTWNVSTDDGYTIWARVSQNQGAQVYGTFYVMDVVCHCFNLTQLAGDYVFGNALGIGKGVGYGGKPTTGNAWNMTELLALSKAAFSAAKTWLLLWSVNYQPNTDSAAGHTTIMCQYNPDNATLNPGTDVYATVDGTEWDTNRPAVGINLSQVTTAGKQRACRWGDGGFASLTTEVVGTNPELRFFGISNLAETKAGPVAYFKGGDFLAVDSDALGNWGQFQTAPDVGMFNGGNVALADVITEPHELSRTHYADVEYLWSSRLSAPGYLALNGGNSRYARHAFTHPYRLCLKVASGSQNQFAYAGTYQNDAHGYHSTQGAHFSRLRPSDVQFQLFGWGLGRGTQKIYRGVAEDVAAVHWDWNPSPNVTPYGAPAVGPSVYIHPGYEGLALTGLTEISPAPDEMFDVRELDPKLALETDLGYEPTWPKFTTGRRRFSLRWNGVTALERDTLAAYVSIEALRTFKWTRPGQAAIALLPVTELRTRSLGVLYVCELSVVELVHLAP